MMDVVLIKPDIVNHQITRDATRGRITPPHGQLYLGAMLRQKGYEVLIIDETLGKDPYNLLVHALNTDPICVGIGTTTGSQINCGIKFAEIIRSKSDIPIVWGGPHPTDWPEQTLEDDLVDIIVIGEGEHSFVDLVMALENGDSLCEIRGIGYKDKNGAHINPPADKIDLDTIPPLPFDLVNMEAYISSINKREITRGYEIITSRGCPYSCAFCHNSIRKELWRYKSVEKIVAEIEYLREEFQVDGILIEDENFFVSKKRIVAFCEELLRRGIKITIRGGAVRADQFSSLDKSMLRLLKKAGFDHFGVGIESGSERILKILNKKITLEQIYDTNQKMKEYGFAVTYNFMSGIPREELEDYVETLKLIYFLLRTNEDLIAPVGVPKFYYPYPNTVLGNKCLGYSYKPMESFRAWGEYNYSNINCSWRSKKIDSIAIRAMHIVRDLQDKFIGKNANITEDDYRTLKDLINIASSL